MYLFKMYKHNYRFASSCAMEFVTFCHLYQLAFFAHLSAESTKSNREIEASGLHHSQTNKPSTKQELKLKTI